MNELRVLVALVGVSVVGILFSEAARAQTPAEFDRLLDGLPVVDETATAAVACQVGPVRACWARLLSFE
jgi:hypothetical protein